MEAGWAFYSKYYYEHGNAAVGQQGTGNNNCQNFLAAAQMGEDPVGDGFGGSGVIHDGAEDGAEHEEGEVGFYISAEGFHEYLGIGSHDMDAAGLSHEQTGKNNADCRQDRGNKNDRPAFIGQVDQ